MKEKRKIGRVAAVALFVALVAAVLFVEGRILRAKFIGDSTTIVNGFYNEKKNDVDMVIIGSSNSFCTIDPRILYKDYGIAAYDFGSSLQPMEISLLYLKEAFKRQQPKVVAFEVNMLVGDTNDLGEEALRWGYTDIPLSIDKLKSIYHSLGNGKMGAEYFSYVFPVFRYHNRWKELTKTDFTYFYKDKTNYTKGYLETGTVYGEGVNLSSYYNECDAWISDENMACFDEMLKLCEENGAKLLLFKSPREGWYSAYTELVEKLAAERGLLFVDYNKLYCENGIELDLAQDFRDTEHLNDYGAAKVTRHLGDYVCQNYDMPDRRGDAEENSWDVAVLYKERKDDRGFFAARTARECIEMLQGDENYVLIVTDAENGSEGKVRQWVYEDGKILIDKVWDRDEVLHVKIGEDSEVVLAKKGWVNQVRVDDVEQYEAGRKWNVVVYDKVVGSVVGSLYFDE